MLRELFDKNKPVLEVHTLFFTVGQSLRVRWLTPADKKTIKWSNYVNVSELEQIFFGSGSPTTSEGNIVMLNIAGYWDIDINRNCKYFVVTEMIFACGEYEHYWKNPDVE